MAGGCAAVSWRSTPPRPRWPPSSSPSPRAASTVAASGAMGASPSPMPTGRYLPRRETPPPGPTPVLTGGPRSSLPGLSAFRLGNDCRLTPAWNTGLGAPSDFSSATVANGVVYIGTGENHGVAALESSSGAVLWQVSVGDAVHSP